jgi:DNA-directed RNA polymerase specialized sigma24 family protein
VADEAVAEAFAQAGRRVEAIRELRPWLFRAAFRIAAGELKRPHSPMRDDVSEVVGSNDGTTELVELAKRLSNAQRRAFVLRDVLGFSTSETAALTGSSEVATRVHLHAARRRLRELILEEES